MTNPRSALHLLLLAGVLAVGLVSFGSALDAPRHPCHPGSPGGPGLGPPCPPTAVPEGGDAGVVDEGTEPGSGPVRFEVINETDLQITVWLGDPIRYVFNVPAESGRTFVVQRSVYAYDLAHCGLRSSGFLNLTLHSYLQVDRCENEKLVRVELVNPSAHQLAAHLDGPGMFVVPLSPGQTRALTIPRGEYQVEIGGCTAEHSVAFSAHAGSTLAVGCP